MKHSLAWIEKFIAPDSQNSVAILTSEKQFEFLLNLIESGKVSASDYLTWASQNYLLPFLDSKFFADVDMTASWNKYASLPFWGPQIFPIGEFENRIMLATHQPPDEFKASFSEPPIFVLASPADLNKTWALLNKKFEAPVKLPEESKGFSITLDKSFKTIELGSETVEMPPLELGQEPEAVEKESESPVGLNLNFDVTKTVAPTFSFGSPKTAAAQPLPPPPPPRSQAKASPEQPNPLGPPLQSKPTAPPAATLKPSMPPPPPLMKVVEPQVAPVLEQKPLPVTPPTAPQPLKTEPVQEAVAAPVQKPLQTKATSFKSLLKRDYSLAKSNFESCTSFEVISDFMFSKMIPPYEASMLLICEDQNLKPVSWAGNFKLTDEAKPSVISLQHPSIFKVVATSGKPYHGYLVANHTNSKFFGEWNSNEIPKHVRIFPIVINKNIFGMWFASTNNKIDLKLMLADLDLLTEQSLTGFKNALKRAA